MKFVYDDGGRGAAGFRGSAGDCVCRAIAIVTGRPYAEIYKRLAAGMGTQRVTKHTKRGRVASARNGVSVRRKWFREYMSELGLEWTPTMHIGSGCTVHLHDGELPTGRLIVSVSRHYTAVINGKVHDTHNPQREIFWMKGDPNGSGIAVLDKVTRRCVYGYWRKAEAEL